MQQLVLFGAGSLAKVLIDLLRDDEQYDVIAVIVDDHYINSTAINLKGVPIVGLSEALLNQKLLDCEMLMTVGYASMRKRQESFEKLKKCGFRMHSFISKDATVASSAVVGEGCIIFPNVVIEPDCILGCNNIIWSNATVCHDSIIDSHNFIAAGVVIGGEVNIGSLCFFGFSSVIIQQAKVADETLLAANSLLIDSSQKATAYKGSPATAFKIHETQGICIK